MSERLGSESENNKTHKDLTTKNKGKGDLLATAISGAILTAIGAATCAHDCQKGNPAIDNSDRISQPTPAMTPANSETPQNHPSK